MFVSFINLISPSLLSANISNFSKGKRNWRERKERIGGKGFNRERESGKLLLISTYVSKEGNRVLLQSWQDLIQIYKDTADTQDTSRYIYIYIYILLVYPCIYIEPGNKSTNKKNKKKVSSWKIWWKTGKVDDMWNESLNLQNCNHLICVESWLKGLLQERMYPSLPFSVTLPGIQMPSELPLQFISLRTSLLLSVTFGIFYRFRTLT